IQAWANSVKAANTTDSKAVIAKLNDLEHDTVLGKFTFDKKGDPNLPPYKFYRWSKGNYAQIN
ncbi:MAG: hypothetical protein RLZ98_3760, partial [Pseudomonadota bacterium]